MQSLAPIALFVYNRPDHTRRTISYLQKNLLAEDSRLFIFSDGAKTETDQAKVNEVRALIKQTDGFKTVKILESAENQGLANAIIAGVSQLVQEYGKVIVFEDDLLSSPFTLRYFNDALQRYLNQEKVMHIGAYMYPLLEKNLPQTFFYRAATSWGWATWNRAWKNFNPDINELIGQFSKPQIKAFSIDGTMNFWKQMKELKSGKNNSWAIRWYASVFLAGGLTLNPSKSLIHNIGHDGSGVHSNKEDIYQVHVARQPVQFFPLELSENEDAYKAIKYFLRNRKGNLLQRMKRFITKKLS
ncbi:glycosyltransferase [uncultured Mucilaginibacter sp.]|uniref:glycosyltransferase n=1 Tax=uncultured Mucilaginibacter sp. TaxID=797541 RepID=UPI00263089D6|nr:glycosyltransferase [uncultured Mucilaginibacter sp.]